MIDQTKQFLMNKYGISDFLLTLHDQALADIKEELDTYDEIREFNQLKVLNAFHEERVSDSMFGTSTGYGYGDLGRDKLDEVYARIFGCEAALVRPHFVSGTHAIGAALMGNLRAGDTLMTITGRPYDTLHNVIGIGAEKNNGSLIEIGVNYVEVDLKDGLPDKEAIAQKLKEHDVKMVHIQRSTGYSWRPSMNLEIMADVIDFIKTQKSDIIIFIDNCYGEFIETLEPTEIGADLMAGSLIKHT